MTARLTSPADRVLILFEVGAAKILFFYRMVKVKGVRRLGGHSHWEPVIPFGNLPFPLGTSHSVWERWDSERGE